MIHAGQKLERPALRDPLVATAIRGRELHLGAVIGVARLTGCHKHATAPSINGRRADRPGTAVWGRAA
ncbi:hypothetical protein [Streptomyces mirabilis]|uniref:hypothetical protein n=1 Tax=Streptomyces mirabilis TaxID=68239 RepID=UPI003324672A